MSETFQIPVDVAEVYERKFVPSIFAEWAPILLDAVAVGAGDSVLDVACGTGIVARTAASRLARPATVIGVDANESMLTVARRVAPAIEWRCGDAADLPFDVAAFDVAVCQMALMFMPDRSRVLAEMGRVVVEGGRVGVVVPAALDDQPAYRPFVEIASRHAGPDARSLLDTYFGCGDADVLGDLFCDAALQIDELRTVAGVASFDSADDFVETEVEGSPLAERIDRPVYDAIRRDVRAELDRYTVSSGRFEIPLLCHVVVARPTRRDVLSST